MATNKVSNKEMRDLVEALVKAETRIDKVAGAMGARWGWAPYSKPSTGGPFLWNDIYVKHSDGWTELIQAAEFLEKYTKS